MINLSITSFPGLNFEQQNLSPKDNHDRTRHLVGNVLDFLHELLQPMPYLNVDPSYFSHFWFQVAM